MCSPDDGPAARAETMPSARKRAREISEHCVYGSMELLDIEMEA